MPPQKINKIITFYQGINRIKTGKCYIKTQIFLCNYNKFNFEKFNIS